MLDFIEGEIVAKEPRRLVIKAGGVGFGLLVSAQTLSVLPPAGSQALVYTSLQAREDGMSLYGFGGKDERAFFDLLIQVSGVGPKLALGILSAYPSETLRKAIVMGDLAVLTGIGGVGKKTAQRLVLELKDKLGQALPDGGDLSGGGGFDGEATGAMAEAMSALLALGYTQGEAARAFAGADLAGADLAGLDVEGLIKLGLKRLARF
ncbi:MAG: Holliday junction branch migration protein RuvA [Peptococcaceae bacterium]|jgi:Holliday junction DNA helicase RuvA|nr:Holliday junction branch migration protein RuvA [Peptococcaceae bacterium]